MIAYFPTAYDDELLYSQLARFYTASGYMAYTYAAEELFLSKIVRPDMEFVNAYTPDAVKAITRDMPMEQIIEKHTMFPYYGRFLPKVRREKAFKALVDMAGNYHNLLPIPNRKGSSDRYLRYCPVCAANDREQHGEAYWHRVHQMTGVHVCPIHRCRLMDSGIIISGKATPSLKTAEEMIWAFWCVWNLTATARSFPFARTTTRKNWKEWIGLNETLKALFSELEQVFFGSDPRYNGENPACTPIEDKIAAELLRMKDREIVELVDSVEPGSRLEDMLFSPIIDVVDAGRTDLDPQVHPNTGEVYWHGWPDGIPIKYKKGGA